MTENKKGIFLAFLSYFIWGIMPLYWKLLIPIDSFVIIFYRIILVAAVCLVIIAKTEGLSAVRESLRPKGAGWTFFLAGIFVTANWGVYVWAVNAGMVIQTSIGHYIEPLMICLFGMILFREKVSKFNIIALLCAAAAILLMVIHYREIPFVAIGLGSTFAIYAAIKKKENGSSMVCLFNETIFLVPPAAIILVWLESTGRGAFQAASPPKYLLLMTTGLVTVLVLWLFAEAEAKTTLSNIGLIAYLAPTISLFLGIFVFHEPFDLVEFLSFVIIWTGLAVFGAGSIWERKRSVSFG